MRLDKFLFTVGIFKSRTLASEAGSRGFVFIDNQIAKPAKSIAIGDIIVIDTAKFYKKIEVLNLPAKNMTKKDAQNCVSILEERIKD